MRHRIVTALALVALAGCGEERHYARYYAAPPAPAPPPPPKRESRPVPTQYEPPAHHAHRPRGALFNDEVSKSIVGTSRRRILALFGPPYARRPPCIYYRDVGYRASFWKFCFEDGVMTGAIGNARLPGAAD